VWCGLSVWCVCVLWCVCGVCVVCGWCGVCVCGVACRVVCVCVVCVCVWCVCVVFGVCGVCVWCVVCVCVCALFLCVYVSVCVSVSVWPTVLYCSAHPMPSRPSIFQCALTSHSVRMICTPDHHDVSAARQTVIFQFRGDLGLLNSTCRDVIHIDSSLPLVL